MRNHQVVRKFSSALLVFGVSLTFFGFSNLPKDAKLQVRDLLKPEHSAITQAFKNWGLINTKTAASLIKETAADPDQSRFLDGKLSSTDASDTFTFTYDGSGEIRVTLAWTDPEGSATSTHDSRTARLVNDLNLTLTGPDGTHYPYVMPWAGNWSDSKLNDAATTGVNTVDNVEQVYLSAPASGTYTVTVNHAGSLTGGQIYSLVLTGGDLSSGTPDPVSNISYSKVAGFGSFSSINIYYIFSRAN